MRPQPCQRCLGAVCPSTPGRTRRPRSPTAHRGRRRFLLPLTWPEAERARPALPAPPGGSRGERGEGKSRAGGEGCVPAGPAVPFTGDAPAGRSAGCETLPGRGAALRAQGRVPAQPYRGGMPCPALAALPCPAALEGERSRAGAVLGEAEEPGRTVESTLMRSPGVGSEPKEKKINKIKNNRRERSSGKAGHIPVKNRPATTCSRKSTGVT